MRAHMTNWSASPADSWPLTANYSSRALIDSRKIFFKYFSDKFQFNVSGVWNWDTKYDDNNNCIIINIKISVLLTHYNVSLSEQAISKKNEADL